MKKYWIISAILLVVLIGEILLGLYWFGVISLPQNDHAAVKDTSSATVPTFLDKRGESLSFADYEALRSQYPGCEIAWNVPFQGSTIPYDVSELTLTSLTEADVDVLLTYCHSLRSVHGETCPDITQLFRLQEAIPGLELTYNVMISGMPYSPSTTTELTLNQAMGSELLEKLQYLPALQTVSISSLDLSGEEAQTLAQNYPNITFLWEKSILGTTYRSDLTELDLSNVQLTSLEQLENDLRYFPALETIDLSYCGLDSETLAAYRDRVRDQYKVVWTVKLGKNWFRTDITTYVPTREHDTVKDKDLAELKYCEDLIAVDLGHMTTLSDFDWINYTPHLQFLVLVETNLSDLTPIGNLKELLYLEIFLCKKVTDYTPLIGCTALRDLNVAKTKGDIKTFAQMPWLKALYANACGASDADKQYLRENLPDVVMELDSPAHLARGWRDRDLYYTMRDLFGMKYIPTNAVHYEERMAGTYGGND